MHIKVTEIVTWHRENREIEEQECKDKSDSREEKKWDIKEEERKTSRGKRK